jgi:deoxyribonuclease-4
MSIAGNPHKALQRGRDAGCQVIQIFTRYRLRWSAKNLTGNEVDAFHEERLKTLVNPVAVHGSYLANLASPDSENVRESVNLLQKEMEWAELLGIPYLVIHPGSHMGDGEDKGLKRVSESINRLYDNLGDCKVNILLENTAGQGNSLGYKFEDFAIIFEDVEARDRLGICFDTCHAFAAGYDFRTQKDYRQLIKNIDNIIGVDKLKLFHVNDSKTDLGSRTDRHDHPGAGLLGLKAFSFLINDPRFEKHSFLLETPKGFDEYGSDYDVKNLELLRKL